MIKRLLLLVLLSPSLLYAMEVGTIGGYPKPKTESSPPVDYSYAGFPTADGVPNSNPTTAVGSDGDRFYGTRMTGITGTAAKAMVYLLPYSSGANGWAVLMNENTVVAEARLPTSNTTADWYTYDFTAVSGQSLDFVVADTLYVGIQYDYDSGNVAVQGARDAIAGTGSYFYATINSISDAPVDVPSYTTSANAGFAAVLVYVEGTL